MIVLADSGVAALFEYLLYAVAATAPSETAGAVTAAAPPEATVVVGADRFARRVFEAAAGGVCVFAHKGIAKQLEPDAEGYGLLRLQPAVHRHHVDFRVDENRCGKALAFKPCDRVVEGQVLCQTAVRGDIAAEVDFNAAAPPAVLVDAIVFLGVHSKVGGRSRRISGENVYAVDLKIDCAWGCPNDGSHPPVADRQAVPAVFYRLVVIQIRS